MASRRTLSLVLATLLALAIIYFVSPLSAHPEDFNPSLTAISDQTPGADADITFTTSLPTGDNILGIWSLDIPDDWSIATHSNQLESNTRLLSRWWRDTWAVSRPLAVKKPG